MVKGRGKCTMGKKPAKDGRRMRKGEGKEEKDIKGDKDRAERWLEGQCEGENKGGKESEEKEEEEREKRQK